jgi:phosphate uptake regulator
MKRKVIKLGPSTHVISLPSKWITKNNIKQGKELEVYEAENHLLIKQPVGQGRSTRITLEDESKKNIYIALSHAYRMGFDKIKVKFQDPDTIKKISRVTEENLLGFEVTKKEENSCQLENITEPTSKKFEVLLRRIFLQIKETQKLVKEDFETNKKENQTEMKEIRISLDRYIFFCRRCITKGVETEKQNVLLWELLTFLMHIHHNYYYLYDFYADNQKQKVNNKTVKILEDLEDYFDRYYKAYFENKSSYLTQKVMHHNQLHRTILTELSNNKNNDNVLLAYLKEIAHLIQVGSSPIRAILAKEEN